VGKRSLGQLAERSGWLFGELLEHEELGAADADVLLGASRRYAELLHDAPERVHGDTSVAVPRLP
jgi:hypothetical protein